MPIRHPRQAGMLLKTGQTTQYNSELDDGYYERGLAKSYTVLTTGQYSGTANIDLAHYAGTAGHIAFVAGTKTITDSDNGLAIFKTGDKIICAGPAEAANIVVLTVATGNVAGEIVTTEAIADETPAGVVTIRKRSAKSNNCVLDNNTGLMWSRYVSAAMGAASDGKMPWTGASYDIFAYAAAANAASLGGYTDWRIPNDLELLGLRRMEAPNALPDTVFASWPQAYVHSSTTRPNGTTQVLACSFANGDLAYVSNTTSMNYTALVRGG